MKYNRLGRTGLFVSEICFGTMTFSDGSWFGGAIGTQGQKEANGPDRKMPGGGCQFHRHGGCLFQRLFRNRHRPGDTATLASARNEIVLATKVFGRMGRCQRRGRLTRSYHGRRRQKPGAAEDGSYRPLPDPRHRSGDAGGRNHAGAGRSRAPGHGAVCRVFPTGRRGASPRPTASPTSAMPNRIEKPAGLLLHGRAGTGARTGAADAAKSVACLVWSPLAGGYLSGKFSPDGESAAEGRRKNFDFPPLDKAKAGELVAAMRPMASRMAHRWRGWRWPMC